MASKTSLENAACLRRNEGSVHRKVSIVTGGYIISCWFHYKFQPKHKLISLRLFFNLGITPLLMFRIQRAHPNLESLGQTKLKLDFEKKY